MKVLPLPPSKRWGYFEFGIIKYAKNQVLIFKTVATILFVQNAISRSISREKKVLQLPPPLKRVGGILSLELSNIAKYQTNCQKPGPHL